MATTPANTAKPTFKVKKSSKKDGDSDRYRLIDDVSLKGRLISTSNMAFLPDDYLVQVTPSDVKSR